MTITLGGCKPRPDVDSGRFIGAAEAIRWGSHGAGEIGAMAGGSA